MKYRKSALILIPFLAIGLGVGIIMQNRASEIKSETPEPYNIQAGAYRRYPPSRPGLICGLLKMEDAQKITGLPRTSLFEFNNGPEFPQYIDTEGKGIFVDCAIGLGKAPGNKTFSLLISWQDYSREKYVDNDFNHMRSLSKEIVGTSERPEQLRGEGYSGEFSANNGGYIIQTCPQNGQFIVVLGTKGSGPLGNSEAWRVALTNLQIRTKKYGACVAADQWGPQSERVRAAKANLKERLRNAGVPDPSLE